MHPALTDAVTHLGAVKDTDRSSDGTSSISTCTCSSEPLQANNAEKACEKI